MSDQIRHKGSSYIYNINWFYTFKTLLQAASSLEELIKVRPAIQDPLKGIEVTELQINVTSTPAQHWL